MKNFAIKLKELRLSKNITQKQLAEQIHVTKQAVSKWEQGKSLPDIVTIEMLAVFFNITVDALINNEAQENKNQHLCEVISARNSKEINQNKALKIVTLVLSSLVIILLICFTVVMRENYLLKNPERITIQDTEIKVLSSDNTQRAANITFNFYNKANEPKSYTSSNFFVATNSNNDDLYIINLNSLNFTIESQNSKTFSINLSQLYSKTFDENSISIIEIFFLGEKIATIKIK